MDKTRKTKTKTQVYSAIDVADLVISMCHSLKTDITNKTLQVILYFIQAEFLSTCGRPCFSDPILARERGVLVPAVYRKYKIHKGSVIPAPSMPDNDGHGQAVNEKDGGKNMWIAVDSPVLPADQARIFGIVRECVSYSPSDLGQTIINQMPWKIGRKQENTVIPNGVIRQFFMD